MPSARATPPTSPPASGLRAHRLRVVVKGGGHSYLGTSNAPDSLLIWTRAMQQVTLHEAFVGAGCAGRVAPVPAVSAGAGALWMDLYHAVTTQAGRYVQGGSCTTVGVAGLVQSGGFNAFSKGFGSAAAGLLEAEIVTADGAVRVVNACSDPELLWALQGGGGSTFGVVTRVTLRTHDLPPSFGAAWGEVKAHSDAAFARLIAHFIGFYQASLFNPHWGEHVHIRPDNTLEIDMISQGLSAVEVRATWQPFFDWVAAAPQDYAGAGTFGTGAWPARTWWDPGQRATMTRDPRPGAPAYHGWSKGDQGEVGIFLHGYDSLWLPAALLDSDRQPALAAALFEASRHQMVRLHFGKGLAGASDEVRAAARRTATNPAVADAFTLVIVAEGERPPAYPGYPRPAIDLAAARQEARAIDSAATVLRRLAPGSGSYVSESNYFNRGWQTEYWGEHYARLRAIKDQYDPDGLFVVHHGVGSEDRSADGFTRLR
jgi:FAD/FMN-containing dehydrogenase